MVKRVLPLLLALAVAGAPVALEACRIACASMPMPHHPSCHENRAAPQQLSPHTRPCDHGTEVTAPSVAAARNSDSAMAVALAVLANHGAALVPTRDHTDVPPSALPNRVDVRLAIPLRI